MAMCVIAMAVIYVLEWKQRQVPNVQLHDKGTTHSLNISEETVPQMLLDVGKTLSSFENSILAGQEKNKQSSNERMNQNWRLSNAMVISESLAASQVVTAPTQYQSYFPTSVPILKPRVIGTPSQCHRPYIHPDCFVYCCFTPSTQRKSILESNEDLLFPTRTLTEKMPLQLPSIDLNESKVDYEREETVFNTHTEKGTSTTTDYLHESSALVKLSTVEMEEHPIHQNQIKPVRELVAPPRSKILNEKNMTEQNASNLEKTVMTQLEQKMKNILKSDRTSLFNGEIERRVRRGTKPFTRKDLPKAIESLRLLELNTSIGQEYCNTLQCAHRSGPRFSYLIPVSKFMAEEYLTLQFNLAIPLIVDHCQPDGKPVACLAPQNGAGDLPHDYIREQNLTEEVDPSWRLPVGLYLRSTYRFRVQARTVVSDTPCSLPLTELGHSFIEFVFVFQRTCDK